MHFMLIKPTLYRAEMQTQTLPFPRQCTWLLSLSSRPSTVSPSWKLGTRRGIKHESIFILAARDAGGIITVLK